MIFFFSQADKKTRLTCTHVSTKNIMSLFSSYGGDGGDQEFLTKHKNKCTFSKSTFRYILSCFYTFNYIFNGTKKCVDVLIVESHFYRLFFTKNTLFAAIFFVDLHEY